MRTAIARQSAGSVADELESMKLKETVKVVRERFAETLTYYDTPRDHWRRTRVVGAIPGRKSALILVATRLKYVANSEWGPLLPGRIASQRIAVPTAGRICAKLLAAPSGPSIAWRRPSFRLSAALQRLCQFASTILSRCHLYLIR